MDIWIVNILTLSKMQRNKKLFPSFVFMKVGLSFPDGFVEVQ